jgi:hypothetical protein
MQEDHIAGLGFKGGEPLAPSYMAAASVVIRRIEAFRMVVEELGDT